MYVVAKIIVSAIVIGVVTEVARKFPTYGGMVAALPIVSILSVIWLYVQGGQSVTLSKFIIGVLWGLPATAMFLLIIYLSLQHSINLFLSIALGTISWGIFIYLQDKVVKVVSIWLFNS